MSHLRVDVGVLSMADHVGALLQVFLEGLRLGGEVRHHAGLQYSGEHLNLLGSCRDARYFTLKNKKIV